MATKKGSGTQARKKQVVVELPEILDKVTYQYSNHARLSSNKWDVRIAFGEIGPTGSVEPKVGLILPHVTAKGLLKALDTVLKGLEKRLGREITDPDQDPVEIVEMETAESARKSGASKRKPN